MTTLATGEVEVTATLGYLKSSSVDFTVTPGGTPEQMAKLSVIATTTDDKRVPDVSVEIAPDKGLHQICHTNQAGSCVFWVFRTAIQVAGTKAGYQPALAMATNEFNGDSLYLIATLTMRPQ